MVRLTSSEYCPSEIGSIARLGAGDYIWSAHDINRFGLSADGDRSILSGTEMDLNRSGSLGRAAALPMLSYK